MGVVKNVTTTPFTFQLDGIRYIHRKNGRCLVADEQGTGKTLQALLHAIRHPELRPVVVICPASLKYQWQSECTKHVGMHAYVLDGTKPALQGMNTRGNIYICNYDILIQRRMNKGKQPGEGWLGWLRSLKPQLVIIDECHACSSLKAKRTKAVRELCRGVPSILAMSGTPLTNRPAELWPVLNILWPKEFKSWWSFCHQHCSMRRTPWGWDVSGASKLPELHKKLHRLGMLRRLKRDVLSQLPKKSKHIVTLPLENPKLYHDAVTDFRSWCKTNLKAGKARKALKAEAFSKLSYMRRLAVAQKMPAVIDWINNWLQGSDGKLIVFAWHLDVVEQLHKKWPKSSVVVTGAVTGRHREEAKERFQKSDSIRLFLGNKAAYEGLNLTAATDTAIIEFPWSPGHLSQASARNDRIGQTVPTTDHLLVGKDSIDVDMVKLLIRKAATLDAVLDGGKVDSIGDIRELLLKGFSK